MAVRRFKVRYGVTVYEHWRGKIAPDSFKRDLERNKGVRIPWGDGEASIVDSASADSAFHFLMDGMYHGVWPHEVIELVEDKPAGTVKA